MTRSSNGGVAPGRTGVGTWSGGRFMNFGEKVDEDRLAAAAPPRRRDLDRDHRRHLRRRARPTALLGQAIAGVDRDAYSLVGAVGHDFYEGERVGPEGLPALHRPAPARARRLRRLPADGDRVRPRAARRRTASTCSCCTTPTAPATRREIVWDGMAALREAGLASAIGVAPGPANGFTLDMLDCFERFGDRIDWAMIILNPLEPWPGELVLDAAAAARRSASSPGSSTTAGSSGATSPTSTPSRPTTTGASGPAGWIEARQRARSSGCGRSPSATG